MQDGLAIFACVYEEAGQWWMWVQSGGFVIRWGAKLGSEATPNYSEPPTEPGINCADARAAIHDLQASVQAGGRIVTGTWFMHEAIVQHELFHVDVLDQYCQDTFSAIQDLIENHALGPSSIGRTAAEEQMLLYIQYTAIPEWKLSIQAEAAAGEAQEEVDARSREVAVLNPVIASLEAWATAHNCPP
ncbi:MAG: hypothetical protein HOP15_00085 [Planctomycetes bacterium]|nr:hypothetical protein [Planctomycetota bacterium]